MITVGTPLLEQLFILMLMIVLGALILVVALEENEKYTIVTVFILTEVAKSIRENWHKLYGKDRFMIKLLLGASPCTYWSIAKREGREVVAAGARLGII